MSLLIEETPLMLLPKLAVKIGLNEAVILQQMHYWNDINKKTNNNFHDGYYWTYNTYEKWKEQFPFWSAKTIQRAIKSLEDKKLIVSDVYNKKHYDRTKWYRINYETLKAIESDTTGQNDLIKQNKVTPPIPETTTKKKDKDKGIKIDSVYVKLYFSYYKAYMEEEHPYIKPEQRERASNRIKEFMDDKEIDLEEMEVIIDKHFNTPYKDYDYNINGFTETIMEHRYFEEIYQKGETWDVR